MPWLIGAGVYVVGLVIVAAALQHELERKPRAVATTVILYPLIPAAIIGLVVNAVF